MRFPISGFTKTYILNGNVMTNEIAGLTDGHIETCSVLTDDGCYTYNQVIIDHEAWEILRLVASVHLSGFVRAMLCTTSWVQDYAVHHRPALYTTDLRP